MLVFEPPIDGDYWAHWNTSRHLRITFGIVNAAAAPTAGVFTAACRPGNDIQAGAAPSAECSSVSPPLRGRWGYAYPPRVAITSFVADDADDADDICGGGDTLTITFSEPTDAAALGEIGGAVAGASGGPQPTPLVSGGALDELLAFEPPLDGANLSGVWATSSVLVLTVRGEPPAALEGESLPGDVGSGDAPGSDGGSGDGGSGDGGHGDGGSGDGGHGDGGSGEYAPTPALPPPAPSGYDWIGRLRVTLRHEAALRDAAQVTRRSTATSPHLSGDCGKPPSIVLFEASDADDADAVCAAGDVLTLYFDVPTDVPPAATRVDIDRLLTFSQELGRSYSGAWSTDATRLHITILASHQHLPPPALDVTVATLRGPHVPLATHLRHANRVLPPSQSSSPQLSGSCGRPPRLSAILPRAGPSDGGRPVTVVGADLMRTAGGVAESLASARCLWVRGPVLPNPPTLVPPPPTPPPPPPAPMPAPTEAAASAAVSDDSTCQPPAEGVPYPKVALASPTPPQSLEPLPSDVDAQLLPQAPLAANDTTIVCVTPPAYDAANASLMITYGDGLTLPPMHALAPDAASDVPVLDGAAGGFSYAFYRSPTLSAIEPIAGPWRGGTILTVHGSLLRAFQRPAVLTNASASTAGVDGDGTTANSTNGPAMGDADTWSEEETSSHPLPARTSPLCRFGAPGGREPLPSYISYMPAEWNGTDRAMCRTPPWPRALWPMEPVIGGVVSDLPFAFFPNGYDEAAWAPKRDGAATTLPRWRHVDAVISSVSPASGPRDATTAITLLGRGFGVHALEMGRAPSLCRIGDMPPAPLLAVNESAGTLVCATPLCPNCTRADLLAADAADADGESAGGRVAARACCGLEAPLPIYVATNGRDWATADPDGSPVQFTYYDRPRVGTLGALPVGAQLTGPPLGGISITIRGVGFGASPDLHGRAACRFGPSIVRANRVSDHGVLCVTPPHLAGIVDVAVAINGADFQLVATPGTAGGTFEYLCSGYPNGVMCVADPSCGWCDGARGGLEPGRCMPCASGGSALGCVQPSADEPLACAHDTASTPARCTPSPPSDGSSAGGNGDACALKSVRQAVLTPHLPVRTHAVISGVLHNRTFGLYRLTPPHTNFALRIALHSDMGTRPCRMFLRKDLPPTGEPALRDTFEIEASGDSTFQSLVIPPNVLGCGQRDGVRDSGVWPDLLRQSRATSWLPIERELIGSLYPGDAQWRSAQQGLVSPDTARPTDAASPSANAHAPHCDVWFLAVFPVAPPPPAPFQPSLRNASLSDDPFNPPAAPPAHFTLRAMLEPQYTSFACADCAPPLPPPYTHFVRHVTEAAPPPPAADRYGSSLTGDCEACGLRLRGTAERVVDDGGQRLRLVHSVRPRAPPQRAAVWHHAKLNVSGGFEIGFEVQFQRPSTCAKSFYSFGGADVEGDDADGGSGGGADPAANASEPRWRKRVTGCSAAGASNGKGALTTGAVGGEGIALVVHNDPAGLEAAGCAGVGVGYAWDASHYATCLERIRSSVALQLSPHFNVSEGVRSGPHVASGEPGFITWGAIDEVGVYVGGENRAPIVTSSFATGGREARLIDGQPHHVRVVYTHGRLQVSIDGERTPFLVVPVDLAAVGAMDARGKAWVGFTAATGISSIDADLLSFSYCQHPGCGAM